MKLEMESMDSATKVSDQALASKMLRGVGLSHEKRVQALIDCGGVDDPARLETVLRVTFPKIGDHERKQGIVLPRAESGRFRSKEPDKAKKKWGYHKHKVHEVELVEPEEREERASVREMLDDDEAED